MEKNPLLAESIPPDTKKSLYPEPFAALVAGREKRKLGDFFGLSNFGINLTTLAPGAVSALLHHHARQDEFLYILEGTPTLVTTDSEYLMNPGECFGVKAGSGLACQLVNQSDEVVKYLEVGDRSPGDAVEYPNDDLKAVSLDNGQWMITHKDGTPY